MAKDNKPELPKRGGFFPTKRRAGDPDGWTDKKRDEDVHEEVSTDHVPKHGDEGYPLGKRNP